MAGHVVEIFIASTNRTWAGVLPRGRALAWRALGPGLNPHSYKKEKKKRKEKTAHLLGEAESHLMG